MDTLLDGYRYRGARAMVILHDRHLRRFLEVWRAADAAEVILPITSDASYASRATLLRHVLDAAGSYMTWMCTQLGLDDPAIDEPPPEGEIAHRAEGHLEHLLARWRLPLVDVGEERFEDRLHEVWGVGYTIDGMLEHAVMHPIRHAFQLEELIAASATGPSARETES
jgi:hypothetical protein